MVDVAAFRALTFAPAHVERLGPATAPPYDAIDAPLRESLCAASPYNVVRLELPVDDTPGRAADHRYRQAGDTYRRWLDSGVLVRDEQPALYVYEQTYEHDGVARRQVGVLGAMELTAFGHRVLPHEHVYPGPVEDRLHLLQHVPANVSPVFAVHRETTDTLEAAIRHTCAGPELTSFTCEDGVTHRLWRETDPDAQAALTRPTADREVLLADGHHRYTAALDLRGERGGTGGSDRILTLLVGDDGPVLRAMHRQVRRLPADWQGRLGAAGGMVEAVEVSSDPGQATARLLDALDTSRTARFAVLTRQGAWTVHGDGLRASVPPSVPDVLADLDVTVLQSLLTRTFEVPEDIEELYYTPAAVPAAERVGAGTHDALFLLRPVSVEDVHRAARHGLRMPPKSTSFSPKPRTGLVLRALDDPTRAAG